MRKLLLLVNENIDLIKEENELLNYKTTTTINSYYYTNSHKLDSPF
jgi:hypothetical protein